MAERTTKPVATRARTAASRASRGTTRTKRSREQPAARSKPPVAKSGLPITDEVASGLAREAEEGYDLSQGSRVGRKSLAGGHGQSPRLNIRTTADLYERARARALREGKTLSQLAREALEKYVK